MRSDQGTRGILVSDNFLCHTLELPYRNNKPNISSIPSGEYNVKIRISPKYGKVYHVKKVPNRSYILIHSGNLAGDVSKGYKSNVAGCILLGLKRGLLFNQWAVLNSRIAVKRFMNHLNMEPFTLKIIEFFKN
jgi:hypothetical protein